MLTHHPPGSGRGVVAKLPLDGPGRRRHRCCHIKALIKGAVTASRRAPPRSSGQQCIVGGGVGGRLRRHERRHERDWGNCRSRDPGTPRPLPQHPPSPSPAAALKLLQKEKKTPEVPATFPPETFAALQHSNPPQTSSHTVGGAKGWKPWKPFLTEDHCHIFHEWRLKPLLAHLSR